jgi:DNA adenine methylase
MDNSQTPHNDLQLAFQTILRNRTQRGGIVAPGASLMRNGENGRGVSSRWYPETLARRIRDAHAFTPRIKFQERDAFAVIREHLHKPNAVFFIDPPYTCGGKNAGRRLYSHSIVDHGALFELIKQVQGHVLCTYSDSEEVRFLARKYSFSVHEVLMKNTHHAHIPELVLFKM